MLIVYALVVTAVGLVLWYRLEYWKTHTELLLEDDERTTAERDFLQKALIELHKKPIYVAMSVDQIERIAMLVSERLEKPKPWLN